MFIPHLRYTREMALVRVTISGTIHAMCTHRRTLTVGVTKDVRGTEFSNGGGVPNVQKMKEKSEGVPVLYI